MHRLCSILYAPYDAYDRNVKWFMLYESKIILKIPWRKCIENVEFSFECVNVFDRNKLFVWENQNWTCRIENHIKIFRVCIQHSISSQVPDLNRPISLHFCTNCSFQKVIQCYLPMRLMLFWGKSFSAIEKQRIQDIWNRKITFNAERKVEPNCGDHVMVIFKRTLMIHYVLIDSYLFVWVS